MKKHRKKKSLYRKKYKYINGTKGVISLFLAILMVPFASIAGALINASRVNSAIAIFDEALCNASDSTLGTYDEFLRKRFGLLAISQDYTTEDFINETFSYYMKENELVLSNTYTNANYETKGVYSLANPDVLLSQIMEYGKYSVPTRMLEEGLELENLVGVIEKNIPGMNILSVFTSKVNTTDKLISLGKKHDELIEKAKSYETAFTEYETAYKEFANASNTYISKKQEYDSSIAQLEKNVTDEKNKEESKEVIAELIKLENELEKINKEKKKDWTIKKKEKESEIAKFKEDNEETLRAYLEAVKNLNNKISEKNTQLGSYLETAKSKKEAYSSKIEILKSAVSGVGTALENVQTAANELQDAIVDDVVTTGKAATSKIKNDNKKEKEKLKEEKEKTSDEEKKKDLQAKMDKLDNENTDISNIEELAVATKDGAKEGLDVFCDSINKYQKALYDTAAANLENLKIKVDEYNIENESTNVNENVYYMSFSGFLTSMDAENYERKLLNDIKNSSGLAILKAIIGFIKALFDVAVLCDGNLNAVIDDGYYNETYGGLPSEKDRTVYPLSSAEEGDKALSDSYKELFGDYSEILNPLGSFDIFEKFNEIGDDLNIIKEKTDWKDLWKIWEIGNKIKEIMDAVGRIINNIGAIINYFTTQFLLDIKQKQLLTGYISYMLSDRTTYSSGKTLNGTSFNERGTAVSDAFNIPGISDFGALFSSIGKVLSDNGKDKCFMGAETEYVLIGSKVEATNQIGTFAIVYVLRLLCDLPVVFADKEVNAVCSAAAAGTFGIGEPVVRLLYILLEPLADTIILVNGEKIPIIKNAAYLTPTQIDDLLEKFVSLGLKKETLEKQQNELANKLKMKNYDAEVAAQTHSKDPLTKVGEVFDISYSQILMLVMAFIPRQTLLNRLSNVIQMEAVENALNNGGEGKVFDLDNSFTFLRVSANFETNEFIPISEGTGVLTSKKRILYRGY